MRLLPIFVLAGLLTGCAHQRRSLWLREADLAHCKQVALESAGLPETWDQLKAKRLTEDPFKFDTAHVEYDIDLDQANRITIIIPSGGRFGWHSCYVAVTIDRYTFKVLKINESYWP